MNRKFKLFLVIMVLVLVTAACQTAATPASCGFVIGDGRGGTDANLHKIVYPGSELVYNTSDEHVVYVPCNSRNYIINDGSVVSSTGEKIGDRNTQMLAYTKTGVPILISASSYWTLNQDEDAMRNFYEVCLKHSCSSSTDLNSARAGDQVVNNSTAGWIDLLDENFMPAMERAAKLAAFQIGDEVWRTHDQDAYDDMATIMSENFSDIIRANLGYSEDLFCGSGNSQWTDPENPGSGDFICTPVRFVIDQVDRAPVEADNNAEGIQQLNQERLDNATVIYGEDAGYWLALQDTIEKCNSGHGTCIINLGGAPVAVPAPAQNVPAPVTTEE